MASTPIVHSPELPAQTASLTMFFNIQVTGAAQRLGTLVTVPAVRSAMDINYPASGGPAGAGEGRYRPPMNLVMQVSPAATGNVAVTYDNNTTPVVTPGAEVGLVMYPGGIYQFPLVGLTLLRPLANANQAIYPVDALTAFQLIASVNPTSVSCWFSD